MVCDDEKAALKRESKNSESSKFSDGSRIETFAWPRREVGREQAKGETPSSSISSNKKCLARNAEKDERNSLEPARETLRPGDLRPEQRGNHGGGAPSRQLSVSSMLGATFSSKVSTTVMGKLRPADRIVST
jgi:hypothetical protein